MDLTPIDDLDDTKHKEINLFSFGDNGKIADTDSDESTKPERSNRSYLEWKELSKSAKIYGKESSEKVSQIGSHAFE